MREEERERGNEGQREFVCVGAKEGGTERARKRARIA